MTKTLTHIISSHQVCHQNKTMIIEFVGPPGVGKTTSCNCFAEKLHAKGLSTCQSEDLKAYLRDMDRITKLQLYFQSLVQNAVVLLKFTGLLAKHKIYSLQSVYRFLRLAIFQAVLFHMVKTKPVDYVLLDQWMIQELWSATIFKTDQVNKLQPELKKFFFKTDYLFYFDLNLETAANRIENRSNGRSRFDRMPPEKRLAEMKKYSEYLHQLFLEADCREKYTLSTEQSPDQNGDLFLQLIAPDLQAHT